MVDIFSIFVFEMEIYCQDRFQKPSLLTNWIFFANRAIYFWYKLPNQIKNRNGVKKFNIEFGHFRKKLQEKEFKKYFCELLDELHFRI